MFQIITLILCFISITPHAFASTSQCKEHSCIIVIDAGSTGSRLHLYSYDLDSTNTAINIRELWSKKIKPGFATLQTDAKIIEAYLTNLFSGAPEKNVPVYFYATAGMRLLPEFKQKIYFDALEHWFKSQARWQLKDARTLTGDKEALYDWLSVNYHLGTLTSSQSNDVGVMDMGGASVQIAFSVQKTQQINSKSNIEIDLYGRHIQLFVYSFLGLGQNEMSHQFLNSPSCYSNAYPLPNGTEALGHAASCEHEISTLINSVHQISNTLQPTLAENPVATWYAIGGISNLAEHKLFHFEQNQLTNAMLLEQAEIQTCNQQWDKLNSQYPNDDYVYQYCLISSFYYALMVDGYGFSPNQTVNYIPTNTNLDWTIGVVLHH